MARSAFLNTWDFPIYVGLATLAMGVGLALADRLAWHAVWWLSPRRRHCAGVLGWLLYLPFYSVSNRSWAAFCPTCSSPARFSQFSVMFGLFLLVILFFLILLSRQAPGRSCGEVSWACLPFTLLTPFALLAFFRAESAPSCRRVRLSSNSFLNNPAVQATSAARPSVGLVGADRASAAGHPVDLAGLGWPVRLGRRACCGRCCIERRSETETTTGEGEPRSPRPRVPVHAASPDLFALLMIGLALLLTYSSPSSSTCAICSARG